MLDDGFLGELKKVDASGKFIAWLIGKFPIRSYSLTTDKLDIGDFKSYLEANTFIKNSLYWTASITIFSNSWINFSSLIIPLTREIVSKGPKVPALKLDTASAKASKSKGDTWSLILLYKTEGS